MTSQQQPIPHLLALFDDTLDHYQKACQSNSASIVRRLGTLRENLLANLPTIANTFVEQLQTQPNLVRLSGSPNEQYFCFGDLHGSLTDLIYLRQLYWRKFKQLQNLHFVFLGDYVDRGIHGFEIVVYLILLKLVHPNHFTILRGNHEIQWMNHGFFLEECRLKFGKRNGDWVWKTLNQCFGVLPYAALINGNIFCCHGGVPRNLRSLDEIDQKIPKGLLDEHGNQLALQLLWNDFRSQEYDKKRVCRIADDDEEESESSDSESAGSSGSSTRQKDKAVQKYFVANRIRNIGYIVGHKAVRHFRRKHGINFIVRAHQFDGVVAKNGFNLHSDQKVLTVFSNSCYIGKGNSTACVCIDSAANKVDIVGLRSEQDCDFNNSEIFECDELADMKFDW